LVHARRAYELGQANLEQVLETENVLLRSQNAYAETVVTLNATIAQLEFGVGGVLPGGRDVGMEVLP
jgi:outer membrane protein TolC